MGRKARDDEAEVPSSEPAKEVAAAASVKTARVAQVAEDSLGGRCVTSTSSYVYGFDFLIGIES